MSLKITNTITGKKQEFKTLVDGKVKMYVCGVTPYDHAHVGHGRCYVTFDIFYRLLRFLGYEVTYCRNFTDIDDKLLSKAEKVLGSKYRYNELADKYIESYHQDMAALNCVPPNYEPRVTKHIQEIIDFIQGLIDKGNAYIVDGDVYFHISSFPVYGKLSKHNVQDLRAGARVDVQEKKKDPLDFALWKGEPEGEFWKSPWGYGRPGWHIECSALASHYLGEQIDVHAGGLDLVFPHHENEIAQSEALHEKPFANYWLHNGFVNIGAEKMSKSIGNIFILDDLFKEFDPMVVRFYFLNHHYRAPLEFSIDGLNSVQKSYQRLCKVFSRCQHEQECGFGQAEKSPIITRMLDFLKDDLNTVGLLGVLFENLDFIAADQKKLCWVKSFVHDVLGLSLVPLVLKQVEITPEIQKLIDERKDARTQKNWARADEIRDQLHNLGVDVQDKKLN